jgi:hypothetical protein
MGLCALLVLGMSCSEAGQKTWTGSKSQFWSDPGNWQEGSAPVNGDSLYFPGSVPVVVNNDLFSLSVGMTTQTSVTVNGNPLTISGTFELFGGNATFNVPVSINVSYMGLSRGSYLFTKAVTVAGGTFNLLGSNTTLEFDSTVSEVNPASLSAINMDSFTTRGTLYFSGDYHVQGANLSLTGQGLGQGSSPAWISALQLNIAAPGIIVRSLHLESPFTGGTMVFSPSVLPGYGTDPPQSNAIDLLRDVHLASPLRMRGIVSGGGTLTIDSGGTLYLDATGSPYAGVITAAANGALVPELSDAFPSASFLTVASGGRLDIASTTQHMQGFTCAGTLSLRPGAALHVTSANISGCTLELSVATGAGSAPGGVPLIVNDGSASITGTFASLPEGATVMVNGVARQITYHGGDGNDVMLLPAQLQDMWWVGAAESGWGMSLIQHGDRLFSVIFAYDSQGLPTWYVMPTGTWDATRSAFTGALYTPHGSPYFAYSTSSLVVGNAVGTMTVQVDSDTQLSIGYTIGGLSATKTLTRQPFGPANGARTGDRGDMWWGGSAQNGWGIAILEQAPTIFPIWYTYDANGNATWFVVPVGSFSSANHFDGRAYRTTGPAWLATTFDPSRVHATDAGSFVLDFNGDNATLNYSIDGHAGTVPIQREAF